MKLTRGKCKVCGEIKDIAVAPGWWVDGMCYECEGKKIGEHD